MTHYSDLQLSVSRLLGGVEDTWTYFCRGSWPTPLPLDPSAHAPSHGLTPLSWTKEWVWRPPRASEVLPVAGKEGNHSRKFPDCGIGVGVGGGE